MNTKTVLEMVAEFHEQFQIDYKGPPRLLPVGLATDRVNFMNEELDEYYKAYVHGNLEGMLDALVDLVYVAVGTAHLHGLDFDEAFRRVHLANKRKARDTKLMNGKEGIIKPEGWEPPFLTDLVRNKDA